MLTLALISIVAHTHPHSHNTAKQDKAFIEAFVAIDKGQIYTCFGEISTYSDRALADCLRYHFLKGESK